MPNAAGVRAYGDEPEEGGGDFGASGQVGGRPFVADWSFDFVPKNALYILQGFYPILCGRAGTTSDRGGHRHDTKTLRNI